VSEGTGGRTTFWGPVVLRRLAVTALLVLAGLAPAAPARADATADWDEISARIAAAMQQLQRPDGSLPDYLSPTPQPYAEAMVGYGLLLRGLRTGERSATEAGLRALEQTVQPGVRGSPRLDSVFKQLAVAAAYNLGSARLAGDPAFETRREALAAWLRQVRPVQLTSDTAGTSNKHLVEAVADLELLRSGIGGGEPGSILAEPAAALTRVHALLVQRWPALVRSQEQLGAIGATAVASDGPTHPLAYHGLSLAMFDRALELLGAQAPSASRAARRAMARGSWALAAPDGDVAYWGRSHEQSWALALTAAGADGLDADRIDGGSRATALRERLAARIASVHGFGPYGVWIVPALRTHPAEGRAAMDDYAANGVYNGLTLVGAEWTEADLSRARGPAFGTLRRGGGLAADRPGARRLGRGLGGFAVARRGDVWFAVRMRAGFGAHAGDPRYGFGLMAAKRRVGGAWRDIVPAAPRMVGGADAAGPALLLRDGRTAGAYGTRIEVTRDDAIVVHGGFRTDAGAVVRRKVRFAFTPTERGVEVSFRVRTGDVVEIADFRRASAPPRAVDVRLVPRRGRARMLLGAAQVRGGFASATLGPVVRVGTQIRAPRPGTLVWAPRP
jgi:hypothetical protein